MIAYKYMFSSMHNTFIFFYISIAPSFMPQKNCVIQTIIINLQVLPYKFSKNRHLGRFFNGVTMSMYILSPFHVFFWRPLIGAQVT